MVSPKLLSLLPLPSELSCRNLEGSEGLRQLIFNITCGMKDAGSPIGGQRLAGRLVRPPPSKSPTMAVAPCAPENSGTWLLAPPGVALGEGVVMARGKVPCPPIPSLPHPQVPRSYLSLQEAVLAEQQRRRREDAVQYLTDRQLEELLQQTPDNDIGEYDDLQSGGWPARGGLGKWGGPLRVGASTSLLQ